MTAAQCTLVMDAGKSGSATFKVTPATPALTTTPAPSATPAPPTPAPVAAVIRPAASLSKGCIKTGKYYGFVKGAFNNSASNRAFTYVLKTRVVLKDGPAKVVKVKVAVPTGEKASKRLKYLKQVKKVRASITNLTGSRAFDTVTIGPSGCR